MTKSCSMMSCLRNWTSSTDNCLTKTRSSKTKTTTTTKTTTKTTKNRMKTTTKHCDQRVARASTSMRMTSNDGSKSSRSKTMTSCHRHHRSNTKNCSASSTTTRSCLTSSTTKKSCST